MVAVAAAVSNDDNIAILLTVISVTELIICVTAISANPFYNFLQVYSW